MQSNTQEWCTKYDSNLGNFSIFSFRLRIEIVEKTIFKIVSQNSWQIQGLMLQLYYKKIS